ncbi:MAG: Ig-like domain-containing protein [Silvibacterium sp.]
MFYRRLPVLMFIGLVLLIIGCSTSSVTAIQVSPTTATAAVGQTAQFTATATYTQGTHPGSSQNATDSATWSSSNPSVATINSSGMATAVAAGTTVITATINGYPGIVSATAEFTVTGSAGGVTGVSIVSISVIPGSQSVSSPNQTSQFIAIGTTSAGATVDLTGQVAWSSSSTQIATIGATSGLATAVGQGTATITALYTNSTGGTAATGTATFTVVGGTTEQFTAVSITPGSLALSASGQTSQLIALGTSGSSGLLLDVTASIQMQWSSSIPSIASVNASGLVKGLSAGTSTITALLTNPDGSVVSNTATVAVSLTAAPEPLLSLTIIPSSITVLNLQDTGNFLAVGTFSSPPYTRDLTDSVTWLSSAPDVFPVNSNNSPVEPVGAAAGVVTAYGSGGATIIAEATANDGSIQTATAQFNCPLVLPNPNGNPPTPGSCYPGSQAPALKATITVYNEGLNTTNWEITAPSATGTPDVIHCGPGWTLNGGTGGSVCAAPYPIGTTVTLTAPSTGAAFGGWSDNCTATAPVTAAGPNSCTVTISPSNPNVTVGAIFN